MAGQNVAENWASCGRQFAADRESGDEGGREKERKERMDAKMLNAKMSMHSLTPPISFI